MNTMTIRTSRWPAIAVATLLVLTACAGAPTSDVPDEPGPLVSAPTEVPSTDEGFPEPTPEDTEATEEPQSGAGGVSVSLPGLPIGGDASVDLNDPTWRCVIVNWTGTADPPPDEVNLTLTELRVEPSSDYEVTDGGCTNRGPCLDRANVLSGESRCAVGIRQVAFTGVDEGSLSVTAGSVACSPQDEAICEQFLAELDTIDVAQSIEWFDALTEPPASDGAAGSDGSVEPDQSPQTDGAGVGDDDGSASSP